MSKLNVIIPVETKARKFHGKLFLALHLLREGHPVLIGEQGRLWDYCDLVEPGQPHAFRSKAGAIFEEVSTTHEREDSVYLDEVIASMDPLERKTIVGNW